MSRPSPEIRIITHGGILRQGKGGSSDDTVVVEPGTTLAAVLAALGIERGVVGVATLEGKIVKLDAVLERDGVIDVYPLFGGG